MVGMEESALSGSESGICRSSPEIADKLAALYGIPVEDISGRLHHFTGAQTSADTGGAR